MTITYPIVEAIPGGNLHSFDYELRMDSSLKIQKSGNDIKIINGTIELSIAQVGQILANGGEVENYTMVVKAPIAGLNSAVAAGLPDRTKPIEGGTQVRQYNDWLAPSNVWMNETHFYFLSVTVAGTYLKGSELAILNGLTGVSVMLTSDPEFVAIQNA